MDSPSVFEYATPIDTNNFGQVSEQFLRRDSSDGLAKRLTVFWLNVDDKEYPSVIPGLTMETDESETWLR